MGVPVPGEGIVSLLMGKGELFGVTFPNGHFFVFNIESGKARDLGPICGGPLFEEPFKSVPRALVIDARGRVWGAGDFGAMFYYDPAKGIIVPLPRLTVAVAGPDGTIFIGESGRISHLYLLFPWER